MAEATRTRMTAAEYAELPETNTPTELIHGQLIVSPSPKTYHQEIAGESYALIRRIAPSGKVLFAPVGVFLDADNVVEPDVFWVSGPDSTCQRGEEGYWHGGPDLVIEVLSPGTAKRDRTIKKDLYEQHGTREYWLVEPYTQLTEVWLLDASGLFEQLGIFDPGDQFTSPVLGDKVIDLQLVWDAAHEWLPGNGNSL